jgi:hypothetical protein
MLNVWPLHFGYFKQSFLNKNSPTLNKMSHLTNFMYFFPKLNFNDWSFSFQTQCSSIISINNVPKMTSQWITWINPWDDLSTFIRSMWDWKGKKKSIYSVTIYIFPIILEYVSQYLINLKHEMFPILFWYEFWERWGRFFHQDYNELDM